MQTTNGDRPGTASQWSSIERWTVERLDRDAGMARIETVPMRSESITEELLTVLLEEGVKVGMDQLSLWDVGQAQIQPMSIDRLTLVLGLRDDEKEALSENMVFWILRGLQENPDRVIPATKAARQTAKDFYRLVTRKEQSKSREESES